MLKIKPKVLLNPFFSAPNMTFKLGNCKDSHSVAAIWMTSTSGNQTFPIKSVITHKVAVSVFIFTLPLSNLPIHTSMRFYAVLATVLA